MSKPLTLSDAAGPLLSVLEAAVRGLKSLEVDFADAEAGGTRESYEAGARDMRINIINEQLQGLRNSYKTLDAITPKYPPAPQPPKSDSDAAF